MTPSFSFFLTLILAGAQASAQPTPPVAPKAQEEKTIPEPGWHRRVFEIKHADVGRLESLIRPFGVAVTSDPGLKAITVNAPPDAMGAIEELVKRLDVTRAFASWTRRSCVFAMVREEKPQEAFVTSHPRRGFTSSRSAGSPSTPQNRPAFASTA